MSLTGKAQIPPYMKCTLTELENPGDRCNCGHDGNMCWLFSEELIICVALYSGLNEGVMLVTTSQRLTHLFRNIWNRDVANVHIWEAETRLNWRCFFDWDKCINYLIIQSFIYRNTFQFSSVQTWMAVHVCVWRCNRCFCGKGNWENGHWFIKSWFICTAKMNRLDEEFEMKSEIHVGHSLTLTCRLIL